MSGFKIIAGDQLILPEWRVVAACGGLDFEAGGTMTVNVYADPQLSPDLPLSTPTAEEFAKYTSDPEEIALLMKQAKPSLRMSAETKQILRLTFGSRDHTPYFHWILSQGMDRLMRGAQAAVAMSAQPDGDATALLRLLVLNLGRLQAWGELNRHRFSAYRLLVNPAVAQALSLPGEHVTEHLSERVVVFKKRLVWPR